MRYRILPPGSTRRSPIYSVGPGYCQQEGQLQQLAFLLSW
jgi:hypothetical protein